MAWDLANQVGIRLSTAQTHSVNVILMGAFPKLPDNELILANRVF